MVVETAQRPTPDEQPGPLAEAINSVSHHLDESAKGISTAYLPVASAMRKFANHSGALAEPARLRQ